MKTILATIQGCSIALFTADGIELVDFVADADIDCDGSGLNPFGDPYFQPETRYKHNGCSLHAEVVPYVVVPPVVLQKTKGKVLGSLCELTNLHNGVRCMAIVGDSGPTRKIGELSPAAAELLGLSGNPNTGGTSEHIIRYLIHVGVPAKLNDVQYELQSA